MNKNLRNKLLIAAVLATSAPLVLTSTTAFAKQGQGQRAEKTEKVSRKAKRGATTFKTVKQQAKADYPARLQEKYRKEVVPLLMQEFGYKNPMEVPRLRKSSAACKKLSEWPA